MHLINYFYADTIRILTSLRSPLANSKKETDEEKLHFLIDCLELKNEFYYEKWACTNLIGLIWKMIPSRPCDIPVELLNAFIWRSINGDDVMNVITAAFILEKLCNTDLIHYIGSKNREKENEIALESTIAAVLAFIIKHEEGIRYIYERPILSGFDVFYVNSKNINNEFALKTLYTSISTSMFYVYYNDNNEYWKNIRLTDRKFNSAVLTALTSFDIQIDIDLPF